MPERSHGKARPSLPRSKDLATVPAVVVRAGDRDRSGRFVPGNKGGAGRGWKELVAKQLGADATSEQAIELAREAKRLHLALLRELPHHGAQVASLVAARARATVIATHYSTKAAEVGISTPEGRTLVELAMKLDARAERLAVTALDVATKLAKRERKGADGPAWLTDAPPALPAQGVEVRGNGYAPPEQAQSLRSRAPAHPDEQAPAALGEGASGADSGFEGDA